ncbi:unnamed protein product [Alopecurus aequalis]
MTSSTMKINLAVDRSSNRVLFADAGSDFVDVLLSFLTLPLSAVHFCGTMASLGCLPELCDSVSRLRESKLLKVEACHGTLLTPPHTHEFGLYPCSRLLFRPIQYSQTYSYPRELMTCPVSLSNQAPLRNALHPSNKASSSGSSPQRKIKLFCDISENKVMYAECNRDFVDLLLGFLTYPLGCVIKNMTHVDGTSQLGNVSFDNLYSSVVELDTAGFISSYDYPVKMLLNPSLCPLRRQCYSHSIEAIMEPEDEPFLSLAAMSKTTCRDCIPDLVEDRAYVVGDDLLVHQASAMSVARFWYMRDKANVVEMDVTVGKPEAVALLRAVLTSKTALTDVFMGWLQEEEPPATKSL